jgi:hypothetical protein
MEIPAGYQMPLQIEMVLDGIVNRKKQLHPSRRSKPAHSAFSSARSPLLSCELGGSRAKVEPLPGTSLMTSSGRVGRFPSWSLWAVYGHGRLCFSDNLHGYLGFGPA